MTKKKSEKQLDKDKERLFKILVERELGPPQLQEMMDIASRVPKEVYFSIFLSYMWSKTHPGNMNGGDIALGTIGGFTLEAALRGGTAANAWAISYLSALGFNLFDDLAADLVDNLSKTAAEIFGGAPGSTKVPWYFIPPVVPPPGGIVDPEQ